MLRPAPSRRPDSRSYRPRCRPAAARSPRCSQYASVNRSPPNRRRTASPSRCRETRRCATGAARWTLRRRRNPTTTSRPCPRSDRRSSRPSARCRTSECPRSPRSARSGRHQWSRRAWSSRQPRPTAALRLGTGSLWLSSGPGFDRGRPSLAAKRRPWPTSDPYSPFRLLLQPTYIICPQGGRASPVSTEKGLRNQRFPRR